VAAVLQQLVAELAAGDQAGVNSLLAGVPDGPSVGAQLLSAYGPAGSSTLAQATIAYVGEEPDVGLTFETAAGTPGPTGSFGCTSGVIDALALP
jgi:hypothetical protein